MKKLSVWIEDNRFGVCPLLLQKDFVSYKRPLTLAVAHFDFTNVSSSNAKFVSFGQVEIDHYFTRMKKSQIDGEMLCSTLAANLTVLKLVSLLEMPTNLTNLPSAPTTLTDMNHCRTLSRSLLLMHNIKRH